MDIKNATFWAAVRTKKERMDLPINCRCAVRASIGEFGTISLDLWLKDGGSKFAEINFSDCNEMKSLANLLNATAEAQIVQDTKG